MRLVNSRSRARLYLLSSGTTRVGGAIGLRSFLIKSPAADLSTGLFFRADIVGILGDF